MARSLFALSLVVLAGVHRMTLSGGHWGSGNLGKPQEIRLGSFLVKMILVNVQRFFYCCQPHGNMTGWWFGTWLDYFSIFWECHHPNWLLYFSEGLKPPTRWTSFHKLLKLATCISSCRCQKKRQSYPHCNLDRESRLSKVSYVIVIGLRGGGTSMGIKPNHGISDNLQETTIDVVKTMVSCTVGFSLSQFSSTSVLLKNPMTIPL